MRLFDFSTGEPVFALDTAFSASFAPMDFGGTLATPERFTVDVTGPASDVITLGHIEECACCGHAGQHAMTNFATEASAGDRFSVMAEAANPVASVQGTAAIFSDNVQSIDVFFSGNGVASLRNDTFPDSASASWIGEEDWTAAEIAIVRAALDDIEAIINVQFNIVTDKAQADLDIIKNNDSGSLGTASSWTYTNSGTGAQWREGSIRMNHTISNRWSQGQEQGGQGYETLVHEIGHILGLGHTHDDALGSDELRGFTNGESAFQAGPDGLNDPINSIMAYRDGWAANGTSQVDHGNRGNFGAWDIQALINIYGANMTTATGDDTYSLPTSNGAGTFFETIWDANGTDTISAAGASSDVVINLLAATLDYTATSGGPVSYVTNGGGVIRGGFTIANGVVIENAVGGNGDDDIDGNSANNTLSGGRGTDTINGGGGDDIIRGNRDNDILSGDAGNDTLYGSSGRDVLYGGADNDNLYGGRDADILIGDEGDDLLNGGGFGDRIVGGVGNDRLVGGGGNDELFGGDDDDALLGGAGADQLFGGAGNDDLNGGGFGDLLDGQTGDDTIRGGFGQDFVIFRVGYGRDTLTDFENDIDKLWIDDALWSGLGTLTTAQVVAQFASVTGGNVEFDFGGGDVLVLQGITSTADLADDIIFY